MINAELLNAPRISLKFILNEHGIVFFPATQEHREIKTHGLSYEDEYRGNAVAGLITPERVEIRFHKAFSDDRIRSIWFQVLRLPELSQAALGQLYYQGRAL